MVSKTNTMIKAELSLIPIEDLIAEIAGRCDVMVIGYLRTIDPYAPIFHIDSKSDKSFTNALGLCALIQADIIERIRENEA